MHYFHYGLFNLWDDDLTVEEHWLDADPPTLKPAVMKDIKEWGGVWNANGLEIKFPDANGAMLWKLKYTKNSQYTSPYKREIPDANGVYVLKGEGLGDLK
jgi:hypothetical protein